MFGINFQKYIKKLKSIFLLSMFPSRCKLCDNFLVYDDEDIICLECKKKMSINNDPLCEICGRVIGKDYSICGDCRIILPPYKKHVSYSTYEGVLREIILLYKYTEVEKLKILLSNFYIELFHKKIKEKFDFLIPVPYFKSYKREFYPVLEVSKILSEKLGIEIITDNLTKIRKTLPQVSLSLKKRINNLNRAFKLKNPQRIRKKRILMIDDVYTTGTTVKKCSELLKKEGASVVVLTLARSII